MHSVFTTAIFLLAAFAAPQAAAATVERQTGTTHLYAVESGTTVGPIYVDASTGLARVGSGSATDLFYISSGELYADVSGSPHAYINFINFGTSCGNSGPVIFTQSDSNKCSSEATFSFSGNDLVYSATGSFELCGTDSHIEFNKGSTPTSGCVNVDIVKA